MAIDRNIVGAVSIVSILFAGSWTVFQTQFGYIAENAKIIREALDVRTRDIDQKINTLTNNVSDLRDWVNREMEIRRALNLEQAEFRQFEKRVDEQLSLLSARLLLIEQTRPTTGELQGVSKNAGEQIDRILIRLDRLESNNRSSQH